MRGTRKITRKPRWPLVAHCQRKHPSACTTRAERLPREFVELEQRQSSTFGDFRVLVALESVYGLRSPAERHQSMLAPLNIDTGAHRMPRCFNDRIHRSLDDAPMK